MPAIAKERVLPTLNSDGTRRRLRPTLSEGRWYRVRRATAYALMLLFVAVPWLEIGASRCSCSTSPQRRFCFFGRTFLPTDGALLMLLMLGIFIGIGVADGALRASVVRVGLPADGVPRVPVPADRALLRTA